MAAIHGDFLENEFQELLPVQTRRQVWYMQDGDRVHTTIANITVLRRMFRRRLISL